MEIGLKERLIGALVLVILAVIIIPWVLRGGSAPNTTVTKSLTLPPAAATSGQTAYHMDLNNSAAPAQAAAATRVSVPEAVTQAALASATQGSPASKAGLAPLAKPAVQPITEPAARAATETGGWAVQAGSYRSEANARSVQRKLIKRGYHAYISRFHKGSRTYFRVRVGPFADRAAARRIVSEVGHAFGGKAEVVPNT
ncbi:MAG TPA: SPOR domain-containing protein [Gammaproteobacteria bacterium]|nr:SPOR domain-containing protein [Gammaproteobacteria bacterium]